MSHPQMPKHLEVRFRWFVLSLMCCHFVLWGLVGVQLMC